MKKTKLKIGVWEHWFAPSYRIIDRMKEKLEIDVKKIDFRKKDCFDEIDVLIIEQNGLNDYIENNNEALNEFVRGGGICWFMHQDWERWTSYFLPKDLDSPLLVNRFCRTIKVSEGDDGFSCYLMPWIEKKGESLFSFPNRIELDEMVYWRTPAHSFSILSPENKPEIIPTAAESCIINTGRWEVLGSFRDAVIQNGALVIQAKYGRGLYFWNQILFPEENIPGTERQLAFWDKYIENVLEHFDAFKNKRRTPRRASRKKLAEKESYKLIGHLHSLDWFGADAPLGTVNAAMKYHGFDIGIMAVKYTRPWGADRLDVEKYSDDRVMFMPGQEFHPFNWNGLKDHNAYHILSMGVDEYTDEFTKSMYSTEESEQYIRTALNYIHSRGGIAGSTHAGTDFWRKFDFDAADVLPFKSEAGSFVEKHWLDGGRITAFASVDMWGIARLKAYPLFNFVMPDGPPTFENVLNAIKSGRIIPAINMNSASVKLGKFLPGSIVSPKDAAELAIFTDAESENELNELRIFLRDKIVFRKKISAKKISCEFPLAGLDLKGFIRVEISGQNAGLISNPFYFEN